ncbi:cytidylyltransferase domain-containing protein [Collinsella intestinalis]|uniref:acylneuraminate cytidylyltransferase family protein n=1 Tax=Collinsella intestinalis TaxID=147207 RepID=UPI0022E98371|nr:acylneuraminate cytidylyltransferase family protein [Collinsella intestinalis]
MINDMSVLAVIPARGGSKGIPGKNIKEVCGHPLIAYTIDAARKSKYIDDVVVSTDSEQIASISNRYGARTPFLRPAHLSGDEARSIDALIHCVDWLSRHGQKYDIAVFLQPTSPLRSASEIDGSLETFIVHGKLGVASVSRVSESPLLMRRLCQSGVLHPLIPVESTIRRQEMPEFFRVNGAIYINMIEGLSSETSLNDNPIGYCMQESRSIDIDCVDDLRAAEELLKASGFGFYAFDNAESNINRIG